MRGPQRGGAARPRLPDREAADDARPVPAVAERAASRSEPGDEPRPRRRLRRGDDSRGTRPARQPRLDAPRERAQQPGGEVPAPARRRAATDAVAARASRRADAARAADGRRAAHAERAPVSVHISARCRGCAVGARRPRARRAAAAPPRRARRALDAATRREHRGAGADRGGRAGRRPRGACRGARARARRATRPRRAAGRLMAYDEALADRIRATIGRDKELTERKMFGGLAFLINGNMSVAASGQGGLLVRVDPDESDALVTKTGARPMGMRGREMAGWLRVESDQVRTKKQLSPWVDRGVAFARSLPAK